MVSPTRRLALAASLVSIGCVACDDAAPAAVAAVDAEISDGDGGKVDSPEDVASDSVGIDTSNDTQGMDSASPDETLDSAAPDSTVVPDTTDTVEATGDTTDTVDPLPPLPEPVSDGLVRGVDPTFWRNMDDFAFSHVAPANVRLYVAVQNANHYAKEPYRAYGADLIRHPESYFANVLVPFVERYADVLWGIDCMNEPEAIIQGSDGNYSDWGVTWDEMRAYLSACADVVHSYGGGLVPVSAGSGWHDWDNLEKGYYDGLGFDFLDAHVYLDDWNLPAASTLSSLPVIIGECGQKSETRDDERQRAATRSCFSQAASGGYLAALSWYYDYAGSQNHLAAKNADGTWRPIGALFHEWSGAGAQGLQTGLNWAWLGGAYDHDFGINPLHPSWGTAYKSEIAGAVVADYDATDIAVMRMWAFEGQEAMPFHSVYADFDDDRDDFVAIHPTTTSLALDGAARDPADASTTGLRVSIATSGAGWQGIERTFPADMPLNLAHASEWLYFANQSLGAAAGVNLYFVVESGNELVTYQTTTNGQLWLTAGAAGNGRASLAAADFQTFWALASAPQVGVARPADAMLEHVRAIGVRVYFANAINGTLGIDSIRIR